MLKRHLGLVAHIFTKLSHNVCLINIHIYIFMYWHVRHKSQLCYGTSLEFVMFFFKEFSYIIDKHLCLKHCIFVKLSQILCLFNVHILVCQNTKCECSLCMVLWFDCVFFGNFHILLHIWNVITSSNFYKLCVKVECKPL